MSELIPGIHYRFPKEKMKKSVRRLWDAYEMVPNAEIYHREFGYYCLEEWYKQGLDPKADFAKEFGFDETSDYYLWGAGWCEAAFDPLFEEKILSSDDKYEIVQDFAGRKVQYFKGKRHGFMPTYLDHPVKDEKTWKELVEWRLQVGTENRINQFNATIPQALEAQKEGKLISMMVVGGYMYLRSLVGPEEIFYMLYDNPELIHTMMKKWFEIADAALIEYQKHVTIDQLAFGEDISYNNGLLISPDMIREFLFPYYKKLYENIQKRNIDQERHVYFYVDTDGNLDDVIPLYKEIGVDVFAPMEVASGCDPVELRKKHPDVVFMGGIDKRVIAKTKEDIDAFLDRVIPYMKKHGGYIPMFDHGVPDEVSLENYRYYRKKMLEFSKL